MPGWLPNAAPLWSSESSTTSIRGFPSIHGSTSDVSTSHRLTPKQRRLRERIWRPVKNGRIDDCRVMIVEVKDELRGILV
jgi:hypothetical protein